MRKSFRILLFTILLFPLGAVAQTNGDLVLRLTSDTGNISALDVNARSALSSAYSEFLRDLLLVPGISVRTDQIDSLLREIQKQSQIDAGTGMGSDSAAYATDKGSRATLILTLKINSSGQKYQFTCLISEIESMNLIGNRSTEFLTIQEFTSEKTDRFAYDVLLTLKQRGYIKDIPADVVSQLLHQNSSSDAYMRYVQDYTRQISEAEKELAALKAKHVNDAEKLEAENQKRALQLKIEMLQKTKEQTEALLEKQRAQDEADQKRAQELKNATGAKQQEFSEMIRRLEAKEKEIRAESISLLSLKNRIALIESDKANLVYLKSQLDEYIKQSDAYFDARCEEDVKKEESKAWRNGETDANNVPTATAIKVRQKQIDKIRNNYELEKKNAASQLTATVTKDLQNYQKQIDENLSELKKTTYVFRSIDITDNYLSLNVAFYDADKKSWTAKSSFNLKGIPKTDTSKVNLPSTQITYRTMTGKEPSDGSNIDDYQAYLDQVDMADLYFRTSVPYLYSEIALTVFYNEFSDKYIVTPVYYRIYKTQDRSQIASYTERDLGRTPYTTPANTSTNTRSSTYTTPSNTPSDSIVFPAETPKYARTVTSSLYKFHSAQKGRNGLYFDTCYANARDFNALELSMQASYGGKYFFYGFDGSVFLIPKKNSLYTETPVNFSAFAGLALNFSDLRFFTELGIGACGYADDPYSTNSGGLSFSVINGLDIITGSVSLGLLYKFRYMSGMGFVDSWGVSLGLLF